jgi:hypothetical protein
MSLATGTRLGPDEVLSVLGAGGMGERFEREARSVVLELVETLHADPRWAELVRWPGIE